jgi:hypothetical protein
MTETPMERDRSYGPEEARWGTLLFRGLLGFCAILLVLGLLHKEEHPHFPWEDWRVFFAAFGFVSYAFIVYAGRVWRKVVMRDEDYYER